MADNVLITAGTGTSVATDDVAGVHYQRVKLVNGTLEATDAISGDAAGLNVHPQPATSGGTPDYHVVSAASTNAANIKPSAGQLFGVHGFNAALYPVAMKFHNTAGTPTAGVGVVHSVVVQAGMPVDRNYPEGIPFSVGIGITIVKGTGSAAPVADADAAAVALNDCVFDVRTK